MRTIHLARASVLAAILCVAAEVLGQDPAGTTGIDKLKAQAPKVFIDGGRLDFDYIRTEITFINHVRDRREADVHVLITEQDTGSGGREYTLTFIGQNGFADARNVLSFVSDKTQTEDEIRAGLTQVLKMGLLGYAARTAIQSRLEVLFRDRIQPTSVDDPWDFWVFSVGANGMVNRERTRQSGSIFGNLSANRVTPAAKLRLGISGFYERTRYDYGGYRYTNISESRDFNGLFVKSLGEHWSAGAFLSVSTSTYRNLRLSVNPAPAVEYNWFRYAESTRRQLRFLYRFQLSDVRYREETIYDKMRERLLSQSLDIALEVKEPWGTASAMLKGSHYFHDPRMNKVTCSGEISIRLVKGLSLNIDASYDRIRDQLGLPKGERTLEEILLRRKEMATDYSYFMSIGLSYTFGSIYSNVVNPRFGSGGGGWRGGWGRGY